MVQLVREPGLGELLGSAFGGGLGSGLQRGFAQRGITQALQGLGITPQQAQQLSGLDAQTLREVLKQQGQSQRQMASQRGTDLFLQQQGLPPGLALLPPQAQAAFIKQELPGLQQARQEVETQESLRDLLPQQEQQVSTNLAQALGINLPENGQELAPSTVQEVERMIERQDMPQQEAKTLSQAKEQIQDFTHAEPTGYQLAPMAKGMRELKAIEQKLNDPLLSKADKIKLERARAQKVATYEKNQEKVDKQEQPYVDEINKLGEANRTTELQLDKMLSLVNTGKIAGPLPSAILTFLKEGVKLGELGGLSLDLFGLTSTETQEFKKLQSDMLRNVKEWFGARVTNDEVKRFMERIPSLNQSDEGKRRVIRDLSLLNKGFSLRKNALDEILEENGGFNPPKLKQLVEKRIKDDLDRIAQQFLEPYESPQELAKQQAQYQAGPFGGVVNLLQTLGENLRI